jgi:hypothetical protein
MDKYGPEYINWIKQINFHDILVEWFTKISNLNKDIKIELIDYSSHTFMYGPNNPQIIII